MTIKKSKGKTIKPGNRQTGRSNQRLDARRKAMTPGKRRSASGNIYYEYRKSRTDLPTDPYKPVKKKTTSAKKRTSTKPKSNPKPRTPKLFTIDNEKAAGKFATGFKYNVLEFEKKGTSISVGNAKAEYEDYKFGKMNRCQMKVQHGVKTSGYGRTDPEYYGSAKKYLSSAKVVSGNTYPLRGELKEMGYKWDSKNKRWVRP